MLPSTPPSVTELIRTRDAWRATLERDYAATAARLQAAYRRTLPALEARLGELVAEIDALETLSPERVRGLKTFARLYRQIEAELDGFARLARNEAGLLADTALGHGANGARDLALAQVGPLRPAVSAAWVRPDPDALARLAGYVDGEAMRARVARFGQAAADSFADTLLAMTAQGKGGAAISRAMSQWFGLPRAWANVHVRTSQMASFRAATHESYRANERVLTGWVWWAELGPRTCMSCIGKHGQTFPLSESLQDHYNGRCVALPVVRGTTWAATVETGPAWFERQGAATQRQMLGGRGFDAYRAGRLNVAGMSHEYHDDIYGRMVRQATLKELGIR